VKSGIVMKRCDFLKQLIRAGLFMLLAMIVLTLGNKIVAKNDCSGCPGNGICKGETDCGKY
jgi:hypothetical protein